MKRIPLLLLILVAVASAYGQDFKFPLKISDNRRYLVDQRGKPFFYNADTGWKLFLKLNNQEVKDYLADRKQKKFNGIQIMLTGFKNEKNVYGAPPFDDPEDFGTVNAAYFDHVEWVIRQADSLGLHLAIAPLWLGCCGEGYGGKGAVGPTSHLFRNGLERARAFGAFVGKRFSKFQNIMWIIGGDIDPFEDRETINALAEGLKEAAPHQLQTFHASSAHSSTDVWENASWLDVVMTYTYFRGFDRAWTKNMPDVYESNYKEYVKTPTKPYFLGESMYEVPSDTFGTALQIRKQAYWSALTGGFGNAYGSPNWDFPNDWRNFLQLPGAASLEHFFTFFNSRPWYEILPDPESKVIVEGAGKFASNDYAVAGVHSKGDFIVVYIPSERTVKINASSVRRAKVKASWFNPSTGELKLIDRYANGKAIEFKTPDAGDWLLFLEGVKK